MFGRNIYNNGLLTPVSSYMHPASKYGDGCDSIQINATKIAYCCTSQSIAITSTGACLAATHTRRNLPVCGYLKRSDLISTCMEFDLYMITCHRSLYECSALQSKVRQQVHQLRYHMLVVTAQRRRIISSHTNMPQLQQHVRLNLNAHVLSNTTT